MATIPTAGYLSTPGRTEGDTKVALESLVASVRHVPWSGQVELPNTIAAGSITPAGSAGVVVVDTEAGAATDDLNNIVTTNYPDGAFLLIRNANAARSVVCKHAISGIGTMQLDRGVDYVLDDTKKWLLIRRHGTDWYELLRGPYRIMSETALKATAFTVNKQDLGKIFLCTGSYTISLAAAAGVGNGFVFGVRNVGSGTLVIDPNSSELIDGATVSSVPPGWSVQCICTGTAWMTIDSTGPPTMENPIVNGMMEVWQRYSTITTLGISGGGYLITADRWHVQVQGLTTRVFTVNRSTSVPSVAQAGVLFNYSLEVDVTTAYASLGSTESIAIRQQITGGTWRHLAQRQLTLSFWVYSTKTGKHSVSLVNVGATRCYVAEYTVNVTNTWEYKTITVAAAPSTIVTSGTTQYGPTLSLYWMLAAGTALKTSSLNTWLTTSSPGVSASTNQVNVFDSTSNFFRLTGVKLEVGAIATAYDVTSFDEEYLRCLQFYQQSNAYGVQFGTISANGGEYIFTNQVGALTVFNSVTVTFPVPMVVGAGAVVFLRSPETGTSQIRNRNTGTECTGSNTYNVSQRGFSILGTTPSGSAVGQTMACHWNADTAL